MTDADLAIRHEVAHKKGGSEKDDCVSVPYLYETVSKFDLDSVRVLLTPEGGGK